LGDSKLKSELVSTLAYSFLGLSRSVKVEADSQIFEGELGATPTGEKLTTYKELCSLASELNQPDLVYKFMNLANHSAMWNSKKGAAFGFGSIMSKAGEQLEPFLPKLIPKLYRYQRDPNPKIKDAMASIWKAIVPDSAKMTQRFFREIITELVNIRFKIFRKKKKK